MKLASLFDGSGGFPLAGVMNGITPVWAAEVEPYPIAVTRSRFPKMKHYGNVCDINGAEVEPVDIITAGSPCQDLSVAGLRAGIYQGKRSNLFFRKHQNSQGNEGSHKWKIPAILRVGERTGSVFGR